MAAVIVEARYAAATVADRGQLWLPGALAWLTTLGWLPLLLAVTRAPSEADLTFLAARIVTGGMWPWNAVLIGLGLLLVVLSCFALAAAGEAALLADANGRVRVGWLAPRVLLLALVSAAPVAAAVMATALAAAAIAPAEFRTADTSGGGPILRTLARLAPFVVVGLLALAAAGAFLAAATRLTVRGERLRAAVRGAPGLLAATVRRSAVALVVTVTVRLAYLVLATGLLTVLWRPIGSRLSQGGAIDVGIGLLLVGFVAIWLCVVSGGGAVHAWGSLLWTRALAVPAPHTDDAATNMEAATRP